jgi:hypothetical protein
MLLERVPKHCAAIRLARAILLAGLLEWPDFDVQMWAVELIPEVRGEAGRRCC